MAVAYGDGTVAGLLDRAASAGDDRGIWWGDSFISYSELAADSRRIAAGLAAHGLKTGDHASIWSPNCLDMLSVLFACARIGVATVLINTRLSSAEAEEIIVRSDSRALFYFGGSGKAGYRDKVSAMGEGTISGLRLVVSLAADGPDAIGGRPVAHPDDLRAHGSIDDVLASPDTSALLFSTSGSTGLSKLVVHTNETMSTHAVDLASALGLHEPSSSTLVPVPLAGAYGATQFLAAVGAAVPITLLEQFDAGQTAEIITRRKITHLNGFDEIIARLLEVATEDEPFPSLRSCIYARFNAGYPNLVEDCERRRIPLRGAYGSSEMLALFTIQSLDAPIERRQAAGGWPVSPNGAFRIRDVETGELLPAGKSGEIELAGPSRLKCYYRNPEASGAQILDDGFFRTGDAGHIAADGSLVYESRLDEIIRLSGYMVSVVEIELFVENLDGVERCQLVRIFTDSGPRPFAFVKMLPGAVFDAELLRRECEARMAKFKIPVAFQVVDEFVVGKSLNGPKIDKKLLTDRAQIIFDGN